MTEATTQIYSPRAQSIHGLEVVAEKAPSADIIVKLGDVRYLVHPRRTAKLDILDLPKGLEESTKSSSHAEGTATALQEGGSGYNATWLPVTVISNFGSLFSDDSCAPESYLEDELQRMRARDDVMIDTFLQAIICLIPSNDDTALSTVSLSWRNSRKIQFARSCDNEILYSAPYFLRGNYLHKVFRLWPDPYDAFMYGVFESGSGVYQDIQSNLIPVPSRLYSPEPGSDIHKPLSGWRIAIKDIFHIRGLKTGAGSKAYQSLSRPATHTAEAVQALIEAGAVIVGKTKTVSFASGAAASDWTEYTCPTNPRGDGRLDPDCSSTGSGVAIAGYEWLDFSIGSDSLGSMVGPAAANGVFGLRPTHGLPFPSTAQDGIIVSELLDTIGHFSRNLSAFEILAKAWFPESTSRNNMFTKHTRFLVHPEFGINYDENECKVIRDFIADAEKVTGMGIERCDLGVLPVSFPDVHAPGMKWREYLSDTVAHIQLYDSYHNSIPFEQDFRHKFGASPSLEPIVAYKRALACETVSKDMYEDQCKRMEKFKKWIRKETMVEGTVMLLPITGAKPSFVDAQPTMKSFIEKQEPRPYTELLGERGRRWQGFGFKHTAVCVLGGLPCISFPVGQTPYSSGSPEQEETFYRPINVMMVGPANSDLGLVSLVKRIFEMSNRPLEVKSGKTIY